MSGISSSTDSGQNYYRQRIDDLENQVHDQLQHDRDTAEKQSTELKKSYDKAAERQTRDVRDTDEAISQHSQEMIRRERDEARNQVAESRKQLYDRMGKVNQEGAFDKTYLRDNLKDLQREYDLKSRKLEETTEAAEEARDRELERRAQDASETLERSHERETADLHEQMRSLHKAAGQYARARSQATADVRRDFDSERTSQENMIREGYEDQIAAMKRQTSRSEDAMANKKEAVLDEQADHYTGLIAQQDRANAKRIEELQRTFQDTIRQEHEADLKRQAQVSDDLHRQLSGQKNEYERAFERQQDASRKDLESHAKIDRQEIKQLQDDVHQRKTSLDYSYLNPAMEAKIRRTFAEDYQKKLDADIKRTDERTQSLKQNYQSRLSELDARQRTQYTRLHQEFNSQQSQDRSQFLDQMSEMERSHRVEVRNKDSEASHQIEAVRRTYTQLLDRQKQDYDQLLADLHSDAVDKLTAARRDSNLALKMAHQEMVDQTSTVIHQYEKKLQDEKDGYESQLNELKSAMARDKSESERRTRQLLDQQSHVYEQKIAQMEFQSKERERMITENYQDQMDRIRRAHALQQQTKS